MKKDDIAILILILVVALLLILGIIRANRICREANPRSISGYRFCLGI